MKTFKEFINEARRVKVPKFKNYEEMARFIQNLNGSDIVLDDVFDPETGESYIEKGESKKKAMGKVKVASIRDKSAFYDFEDIYRYASLSIRDITKVDDVPDIDMDTKIPAVFSRKDNLSIDDDDLFNISYHLDKEYKWLRDQGIRFDVYKKNNRAYVSIGF